MSQSGELVFYTQVAIAHPARAVLDVMHLAGAERIAIASRTLEPDRGWRALQETLEEPFVAAQVAEDDVPTEYFYDGLDLDTAAELYLPDKCVRLHMGRNRIGRELFQAIGEYVPESIAGEFSPSSPIIVVGWHDIFENAEHEEGHFFARAFFSFRLYGIKSPRDWNRYREMVFDVPKVVEVKRRLEDVVGPLEQCVYWDV
jgi:hypothetical protein